jgi:hypothetical protein
MFTPNPKMSTVWVPPGLVTSLTVTVLGPANRLISHVPGAAPIAQVVDGIAGQAAGATAVGNSLLLKVSAWTAIAPPVSPAIGRCLVNGRVVHRCSPQSQFMFIWI